VHARVALEPRRASGVVCRRPVRHTVVGLLLWQGAGLRAGLIDESRLTEHMFWSWNRARSELWNSLISGLVVGLVVVNAEGMTVIAGLIAGLIAALCDGLIAGLFGMRVEVRVGLVVGLAVVVGLGLAVVSRCLAHPAPSTSANDSAAMA
jgi:hypothetical protein